MNLKSYRWTVTDGLKPDSFDFDALASSSHGFSGSEIEQAIVSAMCVAEVKPTRPLSVVMGERLAALRDWAAERTVPAG